MNFLQYYVFNPIRDFVYPPKCCTCNQLLQDHEVRVCSLCWNNFTLVAPTHPTWIEIKTKFEAENLVKDILTCYLFEKEGKLQEVIHLLKYQGMKSIGIKLGRELGEKIVSDSVYSHADCLLPVPLHKLKRRERGFNQSEYICKGISQVTDIAVNSSIIFRRKYTQSQTQLNLIERKENVGDAFEVNPKYQNFVKGKTFILVDDVITTGSTINACAKQLLSFGASNVLAGSLAIAQ